MTKPEIAVATEDPKMLYTILSILDSLGFSASVCHPDNPKCDVVKVLITTPGDKVNLNDSRVILIDENTSQDTIAIDIILRLYDVKMPSLCIIGIDPGMHFGSALIIDGIVVSVQSCQSPSETVDLVSKWLQHLKRKRFDCEIIVRIGTGSRLYSTLFLRRLSESIDEIEIELVDEHHTTTAGAKSDTTSAVLIGARVGLAPKPNDFKLDEKAGYIRSLKRLYTRLTEGGQLTTDQAKAIISGVISLDDLI